jgi:hypothetical protein
MIEPGTVPEHPAFTSGDKVRIVWLTTIEYAAEIPAAQWAVMEDWTRDAWMAEREADDSAYVATVDRQPGDGNPE